MRRTHEAVRDELLVLECQAGSTEALRTLFGRWNPRLSRLAWRLTGHREAAQDVVQEAWLAIVRGLRRIDDPARFRWWAYRIVTNKAADWTRRRSVQRTAARELSDRRETTPVAARRAAEATSAIRRIRTALAALPQEQRTILALHYLEGMSLLEIARVLDVPDGTVKSRLFHARNRLKQALERIEI